MQLIKGEKCKSVVRSTSKHIEVTVHYCRSVIGQFGSAMGVGEAELLPVVLERPVHPHVIGQVAVGQLPSEDHHVAHPLYCCVGMTGHLGTTQREIRESREAHSRWATCLNLSMWVLTGNEATEHKQPRDAQTASRAQPRSVPAYFCRVCLIALHLVGFLLAPGGLTDNAKNSTSAFTTCLTNGLLLD